MLPFGTTAGKVESTYIAPTFTRVTLHATGKLGETEFHQMVNCFGRGPLAEALARVQAGDYLSVTGTFRGKEPYRGKDGKLHSDFSCGVALINEHRAQSEAQG